MKWLCFSLGVFASASSGSVTCSARYDRLSSKNGRRSGGSVSIALPTMMRCALAPQAIVLRGASEAINATAIQTRLATAAIVKLKRGLGERDSSLRRAYCADAEMQVDFVSIAG